MTVTTMQKTIVPPTSVLPDGDALGNDIIADACKSEVKSLLRKGGQSGKSRKGKNNPPRVMFQPQAWTMGGRVD